MSADRYRFVGPIYDALTWLFSGDAIHRCRLAMTTSLRPGQRALFAGVGHGTDARAALQAGAHVTVVDASATMLERCRRTCGADGSLRVLHADVLSTPANAAFDVVFANFFLNVFSAVDVDVVLSHLVGLVAPGGSLVIGDFRRPEGNVALRALLHLHWRCAVWFFALVAGNAVHAVHDHQALVERRGFVVVERQRFSVLGVELYESLRCTRFHPEAPC